MKTVLGIEVLEEPRERQRYAAGDCTERPFPKGELSILDGSLRNHSYRRKSHDRWPNGMPVVVVSRVGLRLHVSTLPSGWKPVDSSGDEMVPRVWKSRSLDVPCGLQSACVLDPAFLPEVWQGKFCKAALESDWGMARPVQPSVP
jgi:hypothetical protein